jgi:hypothetical protein
MVLEVFTSYLYGRKERVHLRFLQSNKISNWHNVEHGVPQGSVLGPLFFNLYVDFPMLINKIFDVIMFADDTSILITANFQDELLQRCTHILNHMSKWYQANWLILNPTKTQFTSGKLPNALYLTYADHFLLEVETIQFLCLQWDNQIACKNCIQLLLRKFPHVAIILYIK